MATDESALKLKEMSVDEVFDYLRGINYYTKGYENIIRQFEDYVTNNSLECSKKFPMILEYEHGIQQTFLIGIEGAAFVGKKIDLEPFIKHVESRKFDEKSLAVNDLTLSVFRIIESGLGGNGIDPKLKDRICRQVLRVARCEIMENEESYPKSNVDSLTIAINDAGGISFVLLFKYIEWSKDSILTTDVRKILEDYANNHIPHTIARHAAIGWNLPLLRKLDSEFTKKLIKKITIIERCKIAFWDAFVSYNNPSEVMLKFMPDWYNEFLNGEIAKDLRERRVYISNMQHVIAGYLRDASGCKDIFDEFINSASAETINTHCWSAFRIENDETAEFKDRLKKLWKNEKFIEKADLGKWLHYSPLEKKENIELLLNYLRSREKVSHGNASDLDEYMDEYPVEAAQCLYYMIEKCKAPGSLDAIGRQLEKLLAKNDRNVKNEFLRIEMLIKSLGYNVEYSKKTLYNVHIKRRECR